MSASRDEIISTLQEMIGDAVRLPDYTDRAIIEVDLIKHEAYEAYHQLDNSESSLYLKYRVYLREGERVLQQWVRYIDEPVEDPPPVGLDYSKSGHWVLAKPEDIPPHDMERIDKVWRALLLVT